MKTWRAKLVPAESALLPTGLRDILPIDAEFEARVVGSLMSVFSKYGYDRVKPPMIEFESSLLTGSGAAVADQTFRIMDPISQRMLGVRPDMTVQIGRIASSRLANAPRPLRLCYAGQVLRVKGSQLRPERQFGQTGIELIGSDKVEADAEVIVLAVSALEKIGVENLTLDLGLPTLVQEICKTFDIDAESVAQLRTALDRKDIRAVKDLGQHLADVFAPLLQATGPAQEALKILQKLELPEDASASLQQLEQIYALVSKRCPNLSMTIDVVENRGYEYHTGASFTFFANGVRGELGRGGRYVGGGSEAATGVTLFTDSLVRALEKPEPQKRVFVPFGTPDTKLIELHDQGFVTVSGLGTEENAEEEAKRLGCSHLLLNEKLEAVSADRA